MNNAKRDASIVQVKVCGVLTVYANMEGMENDQIKWNIIIVGDDIEVIEEAKEILVKELKGKKNVTAPMIEKVLSKTQIKQTQFWMCQEIDLR